MRTYIECPLCLEKVEYASNGQPIGHLIDCAYNPHAKRTKESTMANAQKLLDDIEDAEDLVKAEAKFESWCVTMILVGVAMIGVCVATGVVFGDGWAALPGVIGTLVTILFCTLFAVHIWGDVYDSSGYERRRETNGPKMKLKRAQRAYRNYIASGGS